jgi:YD repeat-containing protein
MVTGSATTAAADTLRSDGLFRVACVGPASCSAVAAGPAAVPPGGVITPPSSAPPLGLTYTLNDTPRITSYGYDADGNQTTLKDARGYTTTTTYNADDQATVVTDPDGEATLTCYDGDGNTAQTVPPVGVAASSLTAASCPTSYPAGYSTRLASDATVDTYNAQGQVTQESTPAPAGQTGSETTTYTYDAQGDLLTTTSPPATNGGSDEVTTNTYNSAGQLATQTTGSGSSASTVSYCYDPDGDKTSVIYADGNAGGPAECSVASPWDRHGEPPGELPDQLRLRLSGRIDIDHNAKDDCRAKRRDHDRDL